MSNFENEASRLRGLAVNPAVRFRWTFHAEKELLKDEIPKIDILNMLKRCRVTLVEMSKGEETWRAEGRDADGREITAVVVVYEDAILIKIITCWAGGRP